MRGEDALGGDHPVDVVRRRLPADEDDVFAVLGPLDCRVGVEHGLAGRGSGRRVETGRSDLELGLGVDHRVQQLVELIRVDANDGVLARDQALLDHVHGGLQRRGSRSLGAAGLEQVEPAVLDRELDVLHVVVVVLEPAHGLQQLVESLGHGFLHVLERLRGADPGDHVLALRVGQELAVEAGLARRRVAREADARPGAVALVAEDHLDDVDGGPEVVSDVVGAPVDLRAGVVPRLEDGTNGTGQLVACVLRESVTRLLEIDGLVGLDEDGQVVRGQVDVLRGSAVFLELGEGVLEAVAVDAVHDAAVHLDQAAVGVVGEARVARRAREARGGFVVQAEVEDRVHHPGHRDGGARAHRDEERILGVSEALARLLLEGAHVPVDLLVEPVRELAACGHVPTAGVRRDREAGRNGNPELRHLGQADALAAQQAAPALRGLVEVVDESGRGHGHAKSSHSLTAILPP